MTHLKALVDLLAAYREFVAIGRMMFRAKHSGLRYGGHMLNMERCNSRMVRARKVLRNG